MSHESPRSTELEVRLRQARCELEQRVRAGEQHVASDILKTHPDIAADEETAIELIYAEFVMLEEIGAEPSPGETIERFPAWRVRLKRLLQVHDAFRDDEALPLDRAGDTLASLVSTHDESSSRASIDALPRRRIGQYALLEEIDRGGMGIVYKARQQGLNRIVAVKSIRAADASPADRSRFRAEAKSVAKLHHPNIIQVYEVGEDEGCDFLSMEYVAGGSLEQRLAKEKLPAREAAKLIATLAEAIHYAHCDGIVHRDLKPANVLMDGDVPKIADFGLAKQMLAGSVAQTQTGAVLGTPCYMSPEQASGKTHEAGPAADVYALGVLLYEMLAGQPPFVGDSPLDTLEMIRIREPTPPSRLVAKVPRDLETICLKCLMKERQRRYATACELADDLQRFLHHEPIHARRVGLAERAWRWTRRHPAVGGLAAILLIVMTAGAVVFVRQQRHVGELFQSAEANRRKAEETGQRAEEAMALAGVNLREAKQAIDRLSLLATSLLDQPGMGDTALRTVEQALEQYEALLKQYGHDHGVRWETARVYERAGLVQLELGQWSDSAQTLQKGIDLYDTLQKNETVDFERSGIHVHHGHALRHLERWTESAAAYGEAIRLLEALLADNAQDESCGLRLANTFVNLAIVFKQHQQLDEAEHAYCRAIAIERGIIERTAGLSTTPAIATDGESDRPRYEVLAARELRRKLFDGKLGHLHELQRKRFLTELAISLDDLAELLDQRGRGEDAEVALREALELRQLAARDVRGEDWRKFYLARSHSHVGHFAVGQQDYAEAVAAYEAAVSLLKELADSYPNRVPYRRDLGAAFSDLGRARRKLGRYADALLSHRQAITIHERLLLDDPESQPLQHSLAQSLYQMGRTLQAAGHDREAIQRFARAAEIRPDSSSYQNQLAWMLVTAQDDTLRDPERALPIAQRAVELWPKSANAWNTLGVAYYRNNDDGQACDALMRSVALSDGGDAHDWFFLAMAHARQNERDVATEWFARARQWCQSQGSLSDGLRRVQEEAVHTLRETVE